MIAIFLFLFIADAIALGYFIYLALFKPENSTEDKPEPREPTDEERKIMELHLNLISGALGRC